MYIGLDCDQSLFRSKIRLNGRSEHASVVYEAASRESLIREFKITTTATETGTSLNKELMSGTMTVHVRYHSWYISLPSSAKQQP